MIHIEKDQNILENENIRVASSTGDYNDSDFIEFYDVNNPSVVAGAFHAQYVKYGSLVYKFNDPVELGEEIYKIDPESTHQSASFVRMKKELLRQMDQGSLEPESLSQVLSDEQAVMEEKITETNQMSEVPVEKIETTTTKMDGDGNIIETTTVTTEEVPVAPEVVVPATQVESVVPVSNDPSVVLPDVNIGVDEVPPVTGGQTVNIIKRRRRLI